MAGFASTLSWRRSIILHTTLIVGYKRPSYFYSTQSGELCAIFQWFFCRRHFHTITLTLFAKRVECFCQIAVSIIPRKYHKQSKRSLYIHIFTVNINSTEWVKLSSLFLLVLQWKSLLFSLFFIRLSSRLQLFNYNVVIFLPLSYISICCRVSNGKL